MCYTKGSMKLWLDDVRTPPTEDWVWVKTVPEARKVIEDHLPETVEVASLDNDLGEGLEEGRRLVYWMAENEIWPDVVMIHSANPVASEYMQGMIARYKP